MTLPALPRPTIDLVFRDTDPADLDPLMRYAAMRDSEAGLTPRYAGMRFNHLITDALRRATTSTPRQTRADPRGEVDVAAIDNTTGLTSGVAPVNLTGRPGAATLSRESLSFVAGTPASSSVVVPVLARINLNRLAGSVRAL